MFVSAPSRLKQRLRWATPLLVVVSVACFLWLVSLDGETERRLALIRWGALSGALPAGLAGWWEAMQSGRVLNLLTALFIHADWSHLLGNMLFLMIFGLPSERAMGGTRFLLLFLLAGALANLAAAVLMDAPNRIIVGASGGVSAVMGAYLVLFPGARLGIVIPLGLFLEFVRAPASLLIGVWALLQVVFTFVGPAFGAVAWSAHLVGFLLGMLFGLLARPGVARRLRRG